MEMIKKYLRNRHISSEKIQKIVDNLRSKKLGITDFLENKTSQPTKFRTKIICDFSDAYILVSGTTTINWAGVDDVAKRLA